MKNTPGVKLINEIKNGDEKVLTKIYKKVYLQMQRYGHAIGAIDAEIEEAVQDAFEVFYRGILSDKLTLTCSVETYIISIAKNVFYANERKRIKTVDDESTNNDAEPDDNGSIEALIEQKKHELFLSEFNKLGEDCQKVLSLTLNGLNAKEITEAMGYTSEKFTKTKRARCRGYLINSIKENPLYEKLRNSTAEDIELFVWGDDTRTEGSV